MLETKALKIQEKECAALFTQRCFLVSQVAMEESQQMQKEALTKLSPEKSHTCIFLYQFSACLTHLREYLPVVFRRKPHSMPKTIDLNSW